MINMLCQYCYVKDCWCGFEYCKECYDLVLLASEEITSYELPKCGALQAEAYGAVQADLKEKLEVKEPPTYEDIVADMKMAGSEEEYFTYWSIVKSFVGVESPAEGVYTCPLCKVPIFIDQENCKVFRCAQLANGEYVNPHAGLGEMISLRKTGVLIAGCMVPLDLNNSEGLRIPTDAAGNPWYY